MIDTAYGSPRRVRNAQLGGDDLRLAPTTSSPRKSGGPITPVVVVAMCAKEDKATSGAFLMIDYGVWVPAFAGTTLRGAFARPGHGITCPTGKSPNAVQPPLAKIFLFA